MTALAYASTARSPGPWRLQEAPATLDPHDAPSGANEAAGDPAAAAQQVADRHLEEREVLALWLLGRVPEAVLQPWVLLRPGRAGRGPGPDVREAAFLLPDGVRYTGDVEIHVRARDFARHGHEADPAYARVVLHLVWEDDRTPAGGPVPLAGGTGLARTVAVAPQLHGDPARLRALVRRGPVGREPCADAATAFGPEETARRLRLEGQRRLAERTWRAASIAAEHGWAEAWAVLLDGALAASAGRRLESEGERARLAAAITAALGVDPLRALANLARAKTPQRLIAALRVGAPTVEPARGAAAVRVPWGAGRAAEVGWNAALPLLGALAVAYGDTELARATARLAASWPAPRPYGRTRALAANLGPVMRGGAARAGALAAQGLLHLQDLWCERGGCGRCPLVASAPQDALPARPDAPLSVGVSAGAALSGSHDTDRRDAMQRSRRTSALGRQP